MTLPRMTKATAAILEAILGASDRQPMWGLEICRTADLVSGTVYPVLDRLAKLGWIESIDEVGPHPGRPPRKFYRFTEEGYELAKASLEWRRVRMARLLITSEAPK